MNLRGWIGSFLLLVALVASVAVPRPVPGGPGLPPLRPVRPPPGPAAPRRGAPARAVQSTCCGVARRWRWKDWARTARKSRFAATIPSRLQYLKKLRMQASRRAIVDFEYWHSCM